MRLAAPDSCSQRNKKPRPACRSFRVDKVGRGCAKIDLRFSREPGFFAIGLEKFFSFCADWHQDDRANPLVRQYQAALDSVLVAHPELSRCAVYCVQCEIRFLTHPRNAGRLDLRCPFGCQRRHRRQCSSQRSAAYYRTAAGKAKKKRLNGRRCAPAAPVSAEEVPLPPTDALSLPTELALPGVVLDEPSVVHSPVLPYLRMVMSLIEGHDFQEQELLQLLRQALRQHSIARRRRSDYVLAFLHQHPP